MLKFFFCLESHTDEILQTLKLRAEIKKLALTLYLGESDLVSFFVKIESSREIIISQMIEASLPCQDSMNNFFVFNQN